MKIGLYFGSFNPIHNGHIGVANLAKSYLDKVWFVVSPKNPDKDILLDENLRLEMVKNSISNYDSFDICDIEFSLDKPSYTYLTLRELKKLYNHDFYLIFGSDSYNNMDKWVGSEEVLNNNFIVVKRNGDIIKDLNSGDRIELDLDCNISSTMIRESVNLRLDISDLVPKEVVKDIKRFYDKRKTTFKDRLLKENVSDVKFEEAFNQVKSYIDYCLSLDKPIRNLIPNSHIAETFKDTLKLLEIEHLYPNEFKKIANDQIELFKSVSVLDIVLNDFSETNLTPSEIERVYLLRTDKHNH